MRVIGRTRTGKIVSDNEGLDTSALFDLYEGFSPDDHYDAACLWMLNAEFDYPSGNRNRGFHIVCSGMDDDKFRVREMTEHARKLREYDRSQTFIRRRNPPDSGSTG